MYNHAKSLESEVSRLKGEMKKALDIADEYEASSSPYARGMAAEIKDAITLSGKE